MLENNRYEHSSPAQAALVMWVIWAAILIGLLMIRGFAAPKSPPLTEEAVEQSYSVMAYVGIGMAAVSMVIRWMIIPRLKTPQSLIQAMVIGLALAEMPGILGMFVVPADQVTERTVLFSLAVACVLVSAPFYAKRQLTGCSPIGHES